MGVALSNCVKRSVRPVLCLALALGSGRAATLERLSIDDMIGKSTAIVRGRVMGSYVAFRGSVIHTYWKVQVRESWKGPQQATVEVAIPGGVVNEYRQSFPGSPQLTEGKEYLLFLWTGRSGLTQIIGLTQGIFDLPTNTTGDVMAVREATANTVLEAGTGRVVTDQRIEIRLKDLSTRIQTNLAGGATK